MQLLPKKYFYRKINIYFTGLIFIFFGIFGLAKNSEAATYYVTQSDQGTHDGLSYGNSMSVSRHNSSTFAPDDIIYLCDTITATVIAPSSGTSGQPIIYRGDLAGHAGIIDGENARNCIDTNQHDYLTINNIRCTKFLNKGISLYRSDYVAIDNCAIDNGGYRGIRISESNHATVSNCAISNIAGVSSDTDGDGIYTATDSGTQGCANVLLDGNTFSGSFNRMPIAMVSCETCEVKNNIFSPSATGLAIDFDMEPNPGQIVSDVKVHNNTFNNTLANQAISATGNAAGSVLSGLEIYDNIINQGGIGKSAITIYSRDPTAPFSIHNNTISGCTSDIIAFAMYGKITPTFYVYSNNLGTTTAGVGVANHDSVAYVYNNIYSGGPGCIFSAGVATSYVYNNTFLNYSAYGVSNYGILTAYNNIFSTADSSVQNIADQTEASGTYDYNLYYSPNDTSNTFYWRGANYNTLAALVSATGLQQHSIQDNPSFVSNSDFHLQSSSRAINAGIDVGLAEDFAGNQIVGLPDIGAYEYVLGNTTPPDAPAGLSVS